MAVKGAPGWCLEVPSWLLDMLCLMKSHVRGKCAVPEPDQGLGMADILEGKFLGTLLCIHQMSIWYHAIEKEKDTAIR